MVDTIPTKGKERVTAAHTRRNFRPDVEGLRAVAVTAVVLYHAHVRALAGGYVGVDVFFVLSGFLITGLLWREISQRGRLSFLGFYARRARRLLPASALVTVVTVAAAAYLLPPLQAHDVIGDGLAASTYWANYRFAAASTSYLTASAPPSPLQHYWSLGVEEQFYVLWPLLLVLLARVRSRTGTSSKALVAAFLTGIGLASFATSYHLTTTDQPWAFFSLPTRAWEFVAGGLVALAVPSLRRVPEGVASVAGWVGLAVVAWSVVSLGSTTAFPGVAALAPVGGTVAVVASETARPMYGPVMLLGRTGFQTVGRLSYSWYLWHWPVLILVPVALGHPVGEVTYLALAGASLVLAWATVRLVERPIRFSPQLAGSAVRSLSLGVALSATAVVGVALVADALPSLAGTGRAPVARFSAGAPAAAPAARPTSPRPTTHGPTTPGPAAPGPTRSGPVDPLVAQLQAASETVSAALNASVSTMDVPVNLTPPLSRARVDEARPFFDGCFASFTDATLRPCVYGDAAGSTTVVLFGDSHATMWFPALDAIANNRGWRLESFGKATCPPAAIPLRSPVLGRSYTECEQWRAAAMSRIATERPALVVVSSAWQYNDSYDFSMYSPQWYQGLTATVAGLRNSGAKVLVLGPIPEPRVDVPVCLSAQLHDVVNCTAVLPDPTVIDTAGVAGEREAVTSAGGSYVDVTPWVCTASRCAAIVDNLVVYRDTNHLTATYATWLAPVVAAQIDLAMRPPPSP